LARPAHALSDLGWHTWLRNREFRPKSMIPVFRVYDAVR